MKCHVTVLHDILLGILELFQDPSSLAASSKIVGKPARWPDFRRQISTIYFYTCRFFNTYFWGFLAEQYLYFCLGLYFKLSITGKVCKVSFWQTLSLKQHTLQNILYESRLVEHVHIWTFDTKQWEFCLKLSNLTDHFLFQLQVNWELVTGVCTP